MEYNSVIRVMNDDEDAKHIRAERHVNGKDVSLDFNSGRSSGAFTVILSPKNAWALLASLADRLEEMQSCTLCGSSDSEHTSTHSDGRVISRTVTIGVGE